MIHFGILQRKYLKRTMDYKFLEVSEHFLINNIDGKELFNENSIILDCGACVGNFTQPLWDKYHCNFYLYEPDPRNFRQLKYRFFDKKIRLYRKLISNPCIDGSKRKFYTGRFPTAGSMEESHRGLDGNCIEVEQTSVNNELKQFNSIDLLKLDLEGEEITVITHMDEETLSKIRQIIVEFHLQSEIDDYTEKDVIYCRELLKHNGFIEIKYEANEGTNKGQEAVYLNEHWSF